MNARHETTVPNFVLREATPADIPLIISLVRELAEYEKLLDAMVGTEEGFRNSLFGDRRYAEVVIGELDGKPVSFAVYFHNFSTFLGKPGLYLEDVYVKPEYRGKGLGKVILGYLAKLAVQRGCGRFEWSVLDWNTPAIEFYRKIGAEPMDEWTVQRVSGEALQKLADSFSSAASVR